ncbi:hypothetical protein C8A05DRAFT_34791 [Staphylotrichum tortipilum]|uniref:Uncharacterized protein n=1 Tax=Staphylotrichum tortipilum TaxID=2831512 RepID=A0AAN6RSU1_9PEZI|nr:hypothetical protein C8A05DRAFT_34791 [Staphylotrichum longicolle]
MASSSSPATCPNSTAPPPIANLPIPQNINVLSTPAIDEPSALRGMTACCAPNEVHLLDGGCHLWCEVPARYFENGTSSQLVKVTVAACVHREAWDWEGGMAVQTQFNGAGRRGGIWRGVVAGLVVMGLVVGM